MLIETLPKISCVTVTTGRVNLIPIALHCFASQTYANKELVVLSQGDKEANQKIKALVDQVDGVF
ncbi:MAG: hypothetical protein ACR2PH_11345, partial [Desulfobulbia bacterium]